jgi:hypothetical protein
MVKNPEKSRAIRGYVEKTPLGRDPQVATGRGNVSIF